MARILFVQPSLQPPGGGNGVAAWMLQALADVHDVELLTCRPYEPSAIDAFYGTALAHRRIAHSTVAARRYRLLDAAPIPLDLLKNALLLRATRKLESTVDLVVSANNEWPVHGVGISYVHYPVRLRPRPEPDIRWYHFRAPLALYYAVSDGLADYGPEDVRRQVLLANSDWTAERLWQLHAARSLTVHPPVAGAFVERDWAAREDVVVSVGRFSPEKRFERVIEIVDGVRSRGHALALTIVGSAGANGSYERSMRQLAARHPWVTIRTELDRPALLALASRCRYGLHGMEEEHFGMAPAELVEAGCLTFVHRSGGQQEIVRSDDLTYADVADAIGRFERVLVDGTHRERLRAHLAAGRGRFAPETFCARVRAIVDDTLVAAAGSSAPARAGRSRIE